jgi:biotin carboxylase
MSMRVWRVWLNSAFSSVATALMLIREGDREGRFHTIYSHPHAHSAAAGAADAFHVEPSGLAAAEYVDWCLAFCREQRVDVFMPSKHAAALSAARGRFLEQGTRLLSAALPAQLELIDDKAAFYAAVELPPAPAPQFREFSDIAQFDAAHAELRARHDTLCVKPSRSVYGLGFAVLDEQRSSAALLLAGASYRIGLADLRRGLAELGQFRSMLLMEYLDGTEYSVDCVGDEGRLACLVARKKLPQPGHGQLIDMRPDIVAACAKLVADFGLNGLFNVQFREGRDGLRLLEINPRMSGGIGMACLAGPNLPYIALRGFVDGHAGLVPAAVRDGMRVGEQGCALELA